HAALGDQILERATHGLPRDPVLRHEFGLGGQPSTVAVPAGGDLVAQPVPQHLIGRPGTHRSDPAPGHELADDDVALDLVGAFADDHQRGVAEVAFHVEFGGVAVAAVDAHGVERDLHGDLGGEQFGHAGLHVAALAAVVAFGGVAGELAGGGEFGGHEI